MTIDNTGEHSLGPIAGDVVQVVTEVVSLGNDGRPLGVDYGRVASPRIAGLVEGMKEQLDQIKD